MYRMKIGLIAAGLLAALTAIFYVSVTSNLKSAVNRDVEEKVARAQRVFQDISRLSSMDLAAMVAERSRRPSVVAVSDKPDETARRQAAFEECEVLNANLQKEGRKADIVAILDSTGKVVARDLNPNAEHGEDMRSKHPAVVRALKGSAVKDVWTLQNRMTEVGVAPITKPDGTIVGALVVGYVVSAKKAQERRDLLGAEIAYFHNGKVHTSSFETAGENKEDVGKTQAIAALLFQGGAFAQQALQKGGPTEVAHFPLDGTDYAVVATALPGSFADKSSGVALLASVSDGVGRARKAGVSIALFGVLAILVALGAAAFTARRFIAPLDQIEQGVSEIMNGNIDHTFKPVGPDFEGLSNSLNVMLARLLGRDEPNEDAVEEEDDAAARWKAEDMLVEEGDGTAGGTAGGSPAALAGEPQAAYFPRLYNEYMAAMKAAGRTTEGISVQAFMAKLALAEAGLKQKWECKAVRFQLLSRGDQTVFRAVRIG